MSLGIAKHGDLWWPASDVKARPAIIRDCKGSVNRLLAHFTGRRCIVQAGGNVGVYPLELAAHFERVYTFEPDADNFRCLAKNLDNFDPSHKVVANYAALGAVPGWCSPVATEPTNCGAHRVSYDDGARTVPVVTIDSLNLTACDAIWLDIEGAEIPALYGAAMTINRFAPVIAVEDKGLHRGFGIADGALAEWLGAKGYSQVDEIGRDKIFKRID